ADAPCLRTQSCLHLSVAYVRSVLLATRGVSEGKWSAPGPRSCRLIPTSGSAPLVGQVMASRERNYAGRWLRSSATSRPIRSQQRMRGFGSTDRMARELLSLIWLGYRLLCAGKTTSCSHELRSSFGSPFLEISSSAVRKVLLYGRSMTALR